MDPDSDSRAKHSSEWDTDDELEMEFFQAIMCDQPVPSSGSSSSNTSKVECFTAMGFPKKMVLQAFEENGEDNPDAILNALLTYSALENSPREDACASPKLCSLSDEDHLDDLSDGDSASGNEDLCCPTVKCPQKVVGTTKSLVDKDRNISLLVDMGYQLEDALAAIEKCGVNAPVEELTDFICAAEIAKSTDDDLQELTVHTNIDRKRKFDVSRSGKRQLGPVKRLNCSESLSLPNPMVGFGVPGSTWCLTRRELPDGATGPPYFFYENVALTPKGVWAQISRFLYDIGPEFVDSIHFSAAARKRGYIHNLPIENRRPILPIPPKTIHEALPETKKWWPSWDRRTKLNCLLTCIGSAQLTERIRKRLEKWDHDPPVSDQQFVIQQCKKWNLVWVGKNKVAVLEPDEMEMLLGFPKNHTRGGGISRTDRYKALGNSFQVDTVAYHLSVLKPIFPTGMNVLSLFSGIGGAEVALHRLGIPLKNVVSVEISAVNRKILQDWWEQTEQRGNLIHIDDVQKVDNTMIEQWMKAFNGFDLVVGGSPCNNLAGGNRRTRDGLHGEHSSLFFHYYRILDRVKLLMQPSRY